MPEDAPRVREVERPVRRAWLGRGAPAACAAVALVGVMGGCSSIKDPSFSVVGVAEGERTDEALVLNFTVQAENPNAEPIPLRDTSYALTLEGVEVFRGRRDAQATLRRYGSHTFVLPAVVPADRYNLLAFDAGRASDGIRYDLTGTVQYITPGALAEVLFDTGVRRPKASLIERGTIELEG